MSAKPFLPTAAMLQALTLPSSCSAAAATVSRFGWVSAAGMWSCAHLLKASSSALAPSASATMQKGDSASHTLLLCTAWCLQQVAKAHLPLEGRCQDLERLESLVPAQSHSAVKSQLQAFMDQWCAVFEQLLTQPEPADQLLETDQASLLDVMDGRLWHFMACCLLASRPVGLPAEAIQTAQLMMNSICQVAGVPTTVISTAENCPLSFSGPKEDQQLTETVSAPNKLNARHSVYGNRLVDAFLGPQPAAELDSGAAAAAAQVASFDDAYHWHTGARLEPTYLGETAETRIIDLWRNASLEQMALCSLLPPGRRARLQETIIMCARPNLIPKHWHIAGLKPNCKEPGRHRPLS